MNTREHLSRNMSSVVRASEASRRDNPTMRGLCVVVADGDKAEDYASPEVAIRARAERDHHNEPCVMVLRFDDVRRRISCPDCARSFVVMASRGVPVVVAADGLHYTAALERPSPEA